MKPQRFSLRIVASAVALALPLWANAAGLGKLTVNSALGQPFSAEIELLTADKDDVGSFRANLASAQSFKDAQIEYAAVLSTLKFELGQRQDGKPVLKISSSKAVNDPFLDMLIELNWAAGRLMREYTVLLDPPGMSAQQTVAPVDVRLPGVSGPVAAKPVQQALEQKPIVPVTKPAESRPVQSTEPAADKVPAQAKTEEKAAAAPTLESSVRVKRGDTLGKIANQYRQSDISLERALIGLFRENPQAFDGNNMNRLKSGATLKLPSQQALSEVDQKSAAREVRMQAADWQAYRAKLAERVAAQSAPEPEKEAPGQVSKGKVTSKVDDKAAPKAESKDVLKLSRSVEAQQAAKQQAAAEAGKKAADEKLAAEKAAAAKAAAEEERIAREKAEKEAAERAAMLEKQIADMKKLAEMKDATAPEANQGSQTPPPKPAPKIAAKPPVTQPEGNWYDVILDNLLYWVGGVGVVGLGGALWWMMGNRRRKGASTDFDDSLLTAGNMDATVAGQAASGGSVNTGDTSFLTDFSQAGLAAVDTHDVDPIAEADVYMAYGRDAQAEEILREALTKTPERHEIRLKLLEILAARRNVSGFESVAGELYAALGGQGGMVWERAQELGRSIDPANPMYGGKVDAAAQVAAPAAVEKAPEIQVEPIAQQPEKRAEPEPEHLENPGGVLEFDMNLAASSAEAAPKQQSAKAEIEEGPTTLGHTLDFDLSDLDLGEPDKGPQIDLDSSPGIQGGTMDFSGLDLNLEEAGTEEEMDEVSTKLDLARAYLDMGDKEGAREILQEVLNEGNDSQKNDARGIMAGL